MALNAHQQRLRDGQMVIAVNLSGRNPDVMGALASAGTHVAFVDCERSGIGLDVATELIRAAKLAGLSPMVRSWSRDPAVLVQYLDRQADGLIVPHIDTAQDAADAVEVVRYACGDKAADKLAEMGLTRTQIFDTTLITPAVAEKLLPKENRVTLDELTVKVSSGLTLARDRSLSQ